jgi:hypothetical protein
VGAFLQQAAQLLAFRLQRPADFLRLAHGAELYQDRRSAVKPAYQARGGCSFPIPVDRSVQKS